MSKCKVCEGERKYPIMDCEGKIHFWIKCPACCGTGIEDEPEPEEIPAGPTAADEAYLAWKSQCA
jgi:hypothetical protein